MNMKYKNIYNVLSKFIHVLTPLIILIYSIYENIIYKKGSDPGGYGSLAIALNIMISIGWLFIVLFVVYLSNMICKKEIYKRIGFNLMKQRRLKGWTQEQLAEKSGVSRSRISKMENGKENFNIESLFLIAQSLEIDFIELLK